MSAPSKQIAGLAGPTLVALSIPEAMQMDMYAAQTAPVVYLNGTLLFVAGLAMVRAHNRWQADWTVLVTLCAWGAMLLGWYRMIWPGGQQAGDSLSTYVLLAALLVVGVILTAAAYLPGRWFARR